MEEMKDVAKRVMRLKIKLPLCSFPVNESVPYDANSCCVCPISVFNRALISGNRSRICVISV